MKKFTLAAIAAMLIPLAGLHAQDRIFTYTYQSLVLSPQQREIEVWNTFSTGKSDYYFGLDHRLEFETGICKNLQAAFYFNVSLESSRAHRDFWAVGTNGQPVMKGEDYINREYEFSFSNEWKYKMSDPAANAIGSALYAELSLGDKEFELEGKLILDKQTGRWVHALNLVGEAEWEPEIEADETEMELEPKYQITYSGAYNIGHRWYLGIEALGDCRQGEGSTNSAVFAGPCFSFARDNFFLNFTVLPQLAGIAGPLDGNLNLNKYEKLQARLLFSYAL